MFSKQLSFVLVCLQFSNNVFCENLVVEAGDLGRIKGFQQRTATNSRNFIVFSGIPYAQPTTKEERFKPSKLKTGPLTKNNETFVANEFLQLCPQNNVILQRSMSIDNSLGPFLAAIDKPTMKKLEQLSEEENEAESVSGNSSETTKSVRTSMGQENCLVININTPMLPKSENYKPVPVIVFMHGGSFTGVWGSLFNGARLLQKDVILVIVTFNYRIGILGFFNLGIDEAPGNAGVYDCITALKWVQKYISYFGGDPTRVTISGQSAGAALVTHLMASPLGAGLFHRAIAASGSAFQQWATATNPIADCLTVAQNAGCYSNEDPNELPDLLAVTKCMQKVSTEKLITALNLYTKEDRLSGNLGFGVACPSVQSENLTIEKVIPEHPYQVFLRGRQLNVPLMMGATRHDGSFVLKKSQDDFLTPNGLLQMPGYIEKHLIYDVFNILGVTDHNLAIVDAVEETYLGEATRSNKIKDKWPGLIDIFSVFFFKSMSYRNVDVHAELQLDCYWYSFDYNGFISLLGSLNFSGSFPLGTAHGDDLLYLFQFLPLVFSSDSRKLSSRLVDYWVNFAYYGNPNGENKENFWPRYSSDNPRFLRIDTEDSVRTNYRADWKHTADELFKTTNKSVADNKVHMG